MFHRFNWTSGRMPKFQQMFSITYIICISTSMLKEKAEKVGEMADNEMEAYFSGELKRLPFEVKGVKNAESLIGESEAPFSGEILEGTEKRAKKVWICSDRKNKGNLEVPSEITNKVMCWS